MRVKTRGSQIIKNIYINKRKTVTLNYHIASGIFQAQSLKKKKKNVTDSISKLMHSSTILSLELLNNT